jgi:hypothetical protein
LARDTAETSATLDEHLRLSPKAPQGITLGDGGVTDHHALPSWACGRSEAFKLKASAAGKGN